MATEAELKADLDRYKAARNRILGGAQSVTVDGVQYVEATFFRIEDAITDLENRIAIVRRGGGFARSAYVGRG